ncbi:MAG: hydrogenase maturation protease [Betaproteobacteria bacterium]|jgi:hydrogenase maturation protease|nr:hydrogenase maturation protease [Betaproteobacteria bacterium]
MLTLETAAQVAPRLVIALGNPSRGDDALGPLIAERLAALGLPGVEVLVDYQLQIEYALDLRGREEVIFVDATVAGDGPFTLEPVAASGDRSVTTHALSPQALLEGYSTLTGEAPPSACVLAVRGYEFELGAALSAQARANLERAFAALESQLRG